MIQHLTTRSTLLLSVLCVMSCVAAQPSLAFADDVASRNAHSEGDAGANSHDLVQGAHVEGHIAFLRTELGITPAQETLWAPVAAAMREDVRNLQEEDNKVRQKQRPDNAIDYLENRVLFADLRAQGEERFLTALRPLYENFSRQQKRVADELLIPHHAE